MSSWPDFQYQACFLPWSKPLNKIAVVILELMGATVTIIHIIWIFLLDFKMYYDIKISWVVPRCLNNTL